MAKRDWAFGLTLLGLLGCSGAGQASSGDEVDVEHETSLKVPWSTYRDAAFKAGDGSSYRAEWDLIFSDEAQLKEYYDQATERDTDKLAVFQRISSGFQPTYPLAKQLDITYCVANSHTNKSTVVADMAAATASWASLANLKFRYDSSQDATCTLTNTHVDFAVVTTTYPALAGCGASKMMWNPTCPYGAGLAVGNGVLSVQYSAFSRYPGMTGAGLFRHELGHILGFRHEHPWAPNQSPCDESVTDTMHDLTGVRLTEFDNTSVMMYPACGGVAGTDYTLSVLDGVGVRAVYGVPPVWWHITFG